MFTAQGPPPGQRGRASGPEGGRGAEAAELRSQRRTRARRPAARLGAPGLNRVTWGLDYPGATTFPGMVLWGASTNGPAALPGRYQVRLTVDGRSQTQPLTIRRHPLRSATDADLKEQFDLAIQIRDKVSEANNAVIRIREIKQQVTERLEKSTDVQLARQASGSRET